MKSRNLNFGLVGAAGFVAPRHMDAIKASGNRLVAAFDPQDSVGILDSYFPDSDFFTVFELFDRHVNKTRSSDNASKVHYIAVCSPNYLHDSHIRFGLRTDCDVICEKPVVLNPWNLENLKMIELETGKRVFSILQLRLHPSVKALRKKIHEATSIKKKVDVTLTYVTSRGRWYLQSWKANGAMSGGIATNIGVHFFDMLIFVFGRVQHSQVHLHTVTQASGFLELENARVRWFLSIENSDVPEKVLAAGKRTYRSLTIDEEEFEFSEGFTDLHRVSYDNIMAGNGFSLDDCMPSIDAVANIRNADVTRRTDSLHPLLGKV